MSTSINLSNDLNNYLKSSGSSINGPSGSSSSAGLSSSNSGFMNGWFGGDKSNGGGSGRDPKSWFSYQPLSTNDNDNISINSQEPASSRNAWFSNPFGPKEPQPKSWLPSLSRSQRIIGFIAFMFMGITCFGLSTIYIPLLLFKARKFAILFTFGSAFIVLSFAILLGPVNHLKHQFSRERIPFTLAYFGSLIATLYFALEVQSTILTTMFALIQIVALIWYVVTYIPGGQSGLMFFSRVAASTVSKTLPV